MPKFYNDIDLRTNQLKNAVIESATSAPSSPAPVPGQIYYDSNDDAIYLRKTDTDGSGTDGWVALSDTTTYTALSAGGLAVDASQQFSLNFNGLGDLTNNSGIPIGNDLIAVYDSTNSLHKKVTYTELISGLGGMTSFQLEDGDGTEVTINQANEVKFVEGNGMDINWSDTDGGTDGDPYDMTFALLAAQTGITSLHADGLTLGNNASADADYFKFVSDYDTDNANGHTTEFSGASSVGAIEAYLDNTKRLTLDADGLHLQDPNEGQPILSIKSLNTTPGNSATIRLIKDVAGGDTEDGEHLGSVEFWGDDEGTNQTQFAGIVGSISESDNTDEAGKLELIVAASDGTDTLLRSGLVLEGEHATGPNEVDVTIAYGGSSTTTVVGNTQMNNTLTVGADTTGKDVKFFGATTGKYMQWDASEDGLVIATPIDEVGLGVYTVDGGTTPNFRVGRSHNEYFGIMQGDRECRIVHRQDESDSTAMYTSFELWDSGSGDSYWDWNWQDGEGANQEDKMRLTKAGELHLKPDASVFAMGADKDITLTHDNGTGGTLASAGNFIVDSTAGSLEVGTSLANAQTLKLGPASATQMVFTPHGTPASEKISITNTAGDASDAIKMTSTAGGVSVDANTEVHITTPLLTVTNSTSGKPDVLIKSTNTDTDAEGSLTFQKDASDGAATGENLGRIDFVGDLNDGSTQGAYAQMVSEISSVAANSEAGKIRMDVLCSSGAATGSLREAFKLEGAANAEIVNAYIGYGSTSTTYIQGNLDVAGTTTTVDSTTVAIGDNKLLLNKDVTGTPSVVDAGIEVERGDYTNVSFFWDESANLWGWDQAVDNASAATSHLLYDWSLDTGGTQIHADNYDNTQNTYTTSWVDSSDDVLLRMTSAGEVGAANQDIKIVAGDNITLTHTDSSNITVAAAAPGDNFAGNNTRFAYIDVTDSDFVSNKYARITHSLGTINPIVQIWEMNAVFDGSPSASQLVDAKVECVSDAIVKISFGSIPDQDLKVTIMEPGTTAATSVAYTGG